jgi:WD40 repeat protein
VDFKRDNPNLIAAGLYDGTVAIWDVRQGGSVPVQSSRDLLKKDGHEKKLPHTDTVWEVKWQDKGDKGESLYSISTDGFVKEWNIRKGLEFTDIMPMKSVANPAKKKKREGSIFR